MASKGVEAREVTWSSEDEEQSSLSVRAPVAVTVEDISEPRTDSPDLAQITSSEKQSCDAEECIGRSSALPLRAMLEINKLKDDHGSFTYYVLHNTKLVIHAEDRQQDTDLERLKRKIEQILAKHNSQVKVIATPESFKASHCGLGIGEAVVVDAHFQTVGLYLQHKSCVYSVTAGHFLKVAPTAAAAQAAESERAMVEIFEKRDVPGVISDPDRVSLEKVFPCVHYTTHMNEKGEFVLNHVDIMLCQIPMMLSGNSLPYKSWNKAQDRCKTCFNRNCSHTREVVYAATEIMYFNDMERVSQERSSPFFVSHLAAHLVTEKKQLVCYPCTQEFVVGEVISYNSAVKVGDNGTVQYMNNVLHIRPLGRARPVLGDSGSVWVTKDTGEAVAITCAMGESCDNGQTISVWLAALLHPCLDALCAKYKNRFTSPKDFKVVA